MTTALRAAHIIGLAWGVGAATVKLVLLLRCRADPGFAPTYITVSRSITRQIVLGTVVLTLSGIGWLLLGYPFSAKLITKLVLVALMWVIGPVIDNVVEPKFRSLAPAAGAPASPAFLRIQGQHLALEATATALFYAIILVWLLA